MLELLKNIFWIIIVLIPLIFGSCEKDEENQTYSILGNWELDTKEQIIEYGFIDPVFGTRIQTGIDNFNNYTGDFNVTFKYNNEVEIFENFDPMDPLIGFFEGVYNYDNISQSLTLTGTNYNLCGFGWIPGGGCNNIVTKLTNTVLKVESTSSNTNNSNDTIYYQEKWVEFKFNKTN